MTVIKSVHIKECWPYKYVKPSDWSTRSQEYKDRRNAEKREARRLKSATVKTTDGKKLLKLPVYEMVRNNDFFDSINEVYRHE
ncbi:hypothetical protein UFOVP176_46 [uncultured Caudovirales phage]|uniref:Uncharacterized protein n=1 Tax=uncultured Caudovirales phage TaxID=2100421 RepID=A0A6J7WCH3_9CAUD|nr:hypothetical protein UFOVP176_46 [uncultured Caudovirales phage]